MNFINKVTLLILIILSGCATSTSPDFKVTQDPLRVSTFGVQTIVKKHVHNGERVSAWVEAKAAIVSKEKGCTHFRKASTDSGYDLNTNLGLSFSTTFKNSSIYECIDVASQKNIASSNDEITIKDGNTSRVYIDLNSAFFRYRELIEKIKKSGN